MTNQTQAQTAPGSGNGDRQPVVLVVMGVSGCGKSTVAEILAQQLNWPFEEGDSLHPERNVQKMAAGQPLNDEDRAPWLEKVAEWVEDQLESGRNGIITCSALKRSYRKMIGRRGAGVVFVYLQGPQELIASRLARRHGHYMPLELLQSQFDDLQEPGDDEPAVAVSIEPPQHEIAEHVIDRLQLTTAGMPAEPDPADGLHPAGEKP